MHLPVSAADPQWGKQRISTSGFTTSYSNQVWNHQPVTNDNGKKKTLGGQTLLHDWFAGVKQKDQTQTLMTVQPNVQNQNFFSYFAHSVSFLLAPRARKKWALTVAAFTVLLRVILEKYVEFFFFHLKIGQLGCKLLTWGLWSREEKRIFYVWI